VLASAAMQGSLATHLALKKEIGPTKKVDRHSKTGIFIIGMNCHFPNNGGTVQLSFALDSRSFLLFPMSSAVTIR
jgi:hypothetical protein